MKLWLLRRLPGRERDKVVGFVVRAETEFDARRCADDAAAAQGSTGCTDPQIMSCVEVPTTGKTGVVMAVFDRN
ncbi:MAG: hypothetical protein ABWY12_13465 [Burkholderiales bacterium]|jgi:hypothetical protein